MGARRRPWELIALPLVTVLVLSAAVLTNALSRPIRYVSLLSGPTDGDGWAGHLQVVDEQAGVTVPVPGTEVLVRVRRGQSEIVRRVETGPEGWGAFELPVPAASQALDVEVVAAENPSQKLVIGRPELSTARWARSAKKRGGELSGHQTGQPGFSLELEPVVLSVPFEARLKIKAGDQALELSVEAEGFEWLKPPPARLDAGESQVVLLRPQSHVAALRIESRVQGGPPAQGDPPTQAKTVPLGSRYVVLPIVPGSLSMAKSEGSHTGSLTILSPVERDAVWFAVVGPEGRGPGGRIELKSQPDGTAVGEISLQRLGETKGRYLRLASSPDGRSPATVGLPLDGQNHSFDALDAFLLDGGDAARSREARRVARVRWTLGAYATVAGLLSLSLFFRRLRVDDRVLQQRLAAAGATPETRDSSPFPLAAALLSLFFAFSLAVLWIVGR